MPISLCLLLFEVYFNWPLEALKSDKKMSKLWTKYENWSKLGKQNRVYRYTPNMYQYMLGSGRVYRYTFKVYRYMSPENAQNVYFLPFFHIFDTQFNSILHKHFKTIPNSSYNLYFYSILLSITYLSSKFFHEFLQKSF